MLENLQVFDAEIQAIDMDEVIYADKHQVVRARIAVY